MKRFLLAPAAAQDLSDIWDYVADDSRAEADRLLEKLRGQILALTTPSGLGHQREDLAEGRPLLFWPVGNYLIIYRERDGFIEVVAIAHGKRDIPASIRRREV